MRNIIVSLSRRAALFYLALAVFSLHTATVFCADAATKATPAGELSVAGVVYIDDAPAVSGQTFFPGNNFRVAAASRSTLMLGNHGRLELYEETAIKLDFSDIQMTGALEAGRLRVFAPAGVTARFVTADATLLADARQPAVFSVERESNRTTVSVETGRVEMSFDNRTQLVSEGQSLSTARVSETTAGGGQRLSGGTKAGLTLGIAGVIAIITLLFTGRSNQETLNFGGCIPASFGASPMNETCR